MTCHVILAAVSWLLYSSNIYLTFSDLDRMLLVAKSQRARRRPFLSVKFVNDSIQVELLPHTDDIYTLTPDTVG